MDESSPPVAESAAPAPSSWRARWSAFRKTTAYGYLTPSLYSYGLGACMGLILWLEPVGPAWPAWVSGVYGFFAGGLMGYVVERAFLVLVIVYERFQPFWDTLGELLSILWKFIEAILEGLAGCLGWLIGLVILVALVKFIWTALP